MIHRNNRFHGLHSLGFVMRRGQMAFGPGLSLKFIVNPRQKTHRVAVVVSRKVSKSAVVRNRIRRRIFETIRQVEHAISEPYDLVFLARDVELKEVRAKDLSKRVHVLLKKSGAIPADTPSATTANHAIVMLKEKKTKDVYHTDRPADL